MVHLPSVTGVRLAEMLNVSVPRTGSRSVTSSTCLLRFLSNDPLREQWRRDAGDLKARGHVKEKPIDRSVEHIHVRGDVQTLVRGRQFRDEYDARDDDAALAETAIVQGHDERSAVLAEHQLKPRLIRCLVVLALHDTRAALHFHVTRYDHVQCRAAGLGKRNCRLCWAAATITGLCSSSSRAMRPVSRRNRTT